MTSQPLRLWLFAVELNDRFAGCEKSFARLVTPPRAVPLQQRRRNLTIRPLATADAKEVRELFIAVNRLLAPPNRRDAFDAYIAGALADEMDRVADYYTEHGGRSRAPT